MSNCYIPGCTELPVVHCLCSNSIKICSAHTSSHILCYGDHTVKKLYTRTLDIDKNKIIDFLIKQQNQLKEKISKLKHYSNQLINLISLKSKDLLKTLTSKKLHLKNQLKIFMSQDILEENLLDQIKIFNFNPLEDHISNIETIEKKLKRLFNTNLWISYSKPDDYAIIFNSNLSSHVELVDLNTIKKFTVDLKINDLTQYCLCCKIEPDKFFVYGGGTSNPRLNTAKIIDIKNFTSKAVSSGSSLSHTGGCLFKNCVYVFGGFDGSRSLVNSKKFSLKSNVWTELIPLPEINHGTNAYALKDRILVSGYQSSNIFAFEPDQNQFSLCKYLLSANAHKYLIENWIVCFGNYLYEIDTQENLVVRESILGQGNWLNSSAWFKRGKFIYFVVTDYGLYRINCEMKTIQLVKIS